MTFWWGYPVSLWLSWLHLHVVTIGAFPSLVLGPGACNWVLPPFETLLHILQSSIQMSPSPGIPLPPPARSGPFLPKLLSPGDLLLFHTFQGLEVPPLSLDSSCLEWGSAPGRLTVGIYFKG